MRNAEVIRQWKILKRIEKSRYVTAAHLAEEHDVALRTIRRDIEALQEAGFPLYDDRESGRKIWRLLDGHSHKTQATFTMAEMAALYFGRHLMSVLSGAPFAADLDSAFVKIRGALPEKSSKYLARISDLFGARPFPSKDYSAKKGVIATLVDATLHERQGPAAVVGHHHEIARDHEKEAHEERAVHREERPQHRCTCRFRDRPKATRRSIGLAHVMGDQQDRQGDAQVVEVV